MSMSKHAGLLSLVMCAGLALAAAPALAQATKDKPQPTSPTSPTGTAPAKPVTDGKPAAGHQPAGKDAANDMMAQWDKANAIGEQHKDMALNMTGKWDTTTTFWMAPKTEGMASKGHAEFEPIMGARYIEAKYTGEMMGKPFKGHSFYAYNTVTKQYESTWIDNASTGIMLMTGTKNAKGDINWTGTYDDPMSGKKKTSKALTHHDGKDKMTYTMWDTASDGTEFKTLEVVYTRAVPTAAEHAKGEKTGEKMDDKKKDGK